MNPHLLLLIEKEMIFNVQNQNYRLIFTEKGLVG